MNVGRTVNANLDGAADDGEAGEGDTIRTDVQNITGRCRFRHDRRRTGRQRAHRCRR